MAKSKTPNDIDDYISQFSPDVQEILSKFRTIIRNAAPDAEEIISYQMPAFRQHGMSATVQDNNFGEVAMKLMNEMWKIVKESNTANSGINHWVYLPDNRMFVGVELLQNSPSPEQLEPMEFELQRHLKHVHVGPYQALPAKWISLKSELAGRGEKISSPSLEVYGHYCDDQLKLQTTILIGLQPQRE